MSFEAVSWEFLENFWIEELSWHCLIKTAQSTVYDSVVDCKDAAQYLIKHLNKYSLDPNNYGIWGSSEGGHLALMTALSPKSDFPTTDPLLSVYTPNFRFANAYCPVTSMIDMNVHAGTGFADTPKCWEEILKTT